MRRVTLELPDDVYSLLQLRAAIDDLRLEEGLTAFLTELARAKAEKRQVLIIRAAFNA